MTSTFYDSASGYGDYSLLWNSLYRQNLEHISDSAMGLALICWPARLKFEYSRAFGFTNSDKLLLIFSQKIIFKLLLNYCNLEFEYSVIII